MKKGKREGRKIGRACGLLGIRCPLLLLPSALSSSPTGTLSASHISAFCGLCVSLTLIHGLLPTLHLPPLRPILVGKATKELQIGWDRSLFPLECAQDAAYLLL